MRCVYCHDIVADDWIDLEQGGIAHAGCALLIWSRHRPALRREIAVKTQELTDEDARRMIGDWENELDGL